MKIFWDLDGPILDVSEKHYSLYHDILLANNMRVLPKKEYWKLKRSGSSLNVILSKTNSENIHNLFKGIWLDEIETSKYHALDKLQSGIIDSLNKIYKKNNLVLVTLRQNRRRLLAQLRDLCLIDLFEAILNSGDDIKPRWKIKYNLINKYLNGNLNKEYCIIGDTKTDIEAGKHLGFTTIAIDRGIRNKQNLKESNPDYIFSSIPEINNYFQSKELVS